jgi:DNA polymerase I-like protein with 3'-5' exonuclease and polymerase domains
MEEPNLQNMPKPITFQLDCKQPGDLARQSITCNIRAAFVAPPGWLMLGADYCQLELRLMAHLSGDEALCDMLRHQANDPFKALAARWLGADPENVSVCCLTADPAISRQLC